MTPRLFIFSGSALFLGPIPDSQLHSHLAIQVILGLGEPFCLTVDEETDEYGAAIVASNVPHLLRVPPSGVLTLLVDPTTELGVAEAETAGGSRVRIPAASRVAEIVAAAEPRLDRPPTRDEAEQLHRRMTALLATDAREGSHDQRSRSLDPRIRKVLAQLDAHRSDAEIWDLKRLADHVSLSPVRLRHLFCAQVGLPVRSYRLWVRIARAMEFLGDGHSLTRAAHGAGFVDSGHLSRAFRRMFGITPSSLSSDGEITRM